VNSEHELKFSTPEEGAPDEAALREAVEAAGFELGPAVDVSHKDRYYDDSRLSLSRAGYALRRRMGEGKVVATLKTKGTVAGASHQRGELELPLEGNDWPKAIYDRIAPVCVPGYLQPQTVIETERVIYSVLEEGAVIAILSFDAVTGKAQNGTASVSFNEVEVEAKGEVEERKLEAIAQAVGQVLPLVPSESTKLERVRQLLMGGGPFA